MKVALNYNSPETIEPLRSQIPDVYIVDVGSNPPIKAANERFEENLYWVGNWDKWLKKTSAKRVWMLNDDIAKMPKHAYKLLNEIMDQTGAFMVTPCFNSPHKVFHQDVKEFECYREVTWVDMTVPLIDVAKFKQLGGFDLQFKGYFGDIDLSYRARLAGFKMYATDLLTFHHIGGYTTEKEGTAWAQSNLADQEIIFNKWGKTFHQLIK